MNRPRLIPVLLLKNGVIVRSQRFRTHQVIGNPMSTVERFSHWNVDELVVLDISADDFHDLRRDDIQQSYGGDSALDVLAEIAEVCFMPLTFGGQIRTLDEIEARLAAGADRITLNTAAIRDPELITAAASRFGTQCVVVSIDAARSESGEYDVYAGGGSEATGLTASIWAARAQEAGAGEILLNSIDRDGSGLGYDLELLRRVTESVSIPVIACGGVGAYEHLAAGITEAGASAVAAANIFHFFELSYPLAKQACIDAGVPMRPVSLGGAYFRREPLYEVDAASHAIDTRRRHAAAEPGTNGAPGEGSRRGPNARWCRRCVYPSMAAAPMEFDAEGVCMGCRMAEVKDAIDDAAWERRRQLLLDIFARTRSTDGSRYDCVIPVSGGKDSYFQTHLITREFGLKPLLVTYDGNNWTPTGWRNVQRMKSVFGVDHLFYSPSVELLKKLNRAAFAIMGDMNWHAHVGITTVPVIAAAMMQIPLIIWGEHGYLDLCGQFSMDDFPEMSYRDRLEHFARGYEWTYFVGLEDIGEQDMWMYKYPSDQRLFDLDLSGIYIGNYVRWEANEHAPLMMREYDWQPSPEPFDRTYRTMSNLDDMHENGVHDYLKFIKFGYGRATDHACKDVRAGRMSRDEALEMVRKYDHVKPRDLARWLDYVGMDESEFDAIADTMRDARVWLWSDGAWIKDNIWEAV